MTSITNFFLIAIVLTMIAFTILNVAFGESNTYTLCVSYSGGDDCSYTWEVLQFEEFEEILELYEVETPEGKIVAGITIASEKTVIIRADDDTATPFGHESRHAVCNIEFQKVHGEFEVLKNCHDVVDLDYTAQSTRPESDKIGVNDIPIPEISEKMKFQLTQNLSGNVI